MADKPTSIQLSPLDQKRLAKLRRILTKQYGKVSTTFIFREALRYMENAYDEAK